MATQQGVPLRSEGLGAAVLGEALVEVGPVAGFFSVDEVQREGDEGVEEVVEFVFVAEVGPDLAADGVDGGRVELAGGFGEGAA